METIEILDPILALLRQSGGFCSRRNSLHTASDLRQEAAIAAWRAYRHFDPERASLPTFLHHVVANRIACLRIAEARRLRGYRGVPLDSVALAAPTHCFDLRLDVARVLAAVSAHDRRVARCLCEHSVAEASRELGLSRAAVYRAIVRLRVAFAAAGYCQCSYQAGAWDTGISA